MSKVYSSTGLFLQIVLRAGALAAVTFFVFTAAAQNASAATYTVDTTADVEAFSACSATTVNDCSLRGAIAAANLTVDADTIDFAIPATDPNCPGGACTITLAGSELVISSFRITGYHQEPVYKDIFDEDGNWVGQEVDYYASIPEYGPTGNLTITNSTGAANLVISGNNLSRVFSIRGNNGSYYGGASNVTLNGLTVTGGSSFYGGGISASDSSINISNSVVRDNTAVDGSRGGGIYISSGDLEITNSTVSGNTAVTGGGIEAVIGKLFLTNCTVSGNIAQYSGGGIQIFREVMNLNSVTVTQNQATTGGGIHNDDSYSHVSYATLYNTIVAGNTATLQAPDVYGSILPPSSYNIIGDGTGIRGITNGLDVNQIGTSANPINAKLGALANNGGATLTHALLIGSPAIDAGNTTLTTDQRGSKRPVDSASIPNQTGGNGSDIGAFEVQISQPTSINQCKNDGWKQFTNPKFKNQGDCIQFVNTGK